MAARPNMDGGREGSIPYDASPKDFQYQQMVLQIHLLLLK